MLLFNTDYVKYLSLRGYIFLFIHVGCNNNKSNQFYLIMCHLYILKTTFLFR